MGKVFKDLKVMYSTAAFPISVTMTLTLYPKGRCSRDLLSIDYHYEAAGERAGGDGVLGHRCGERSLDQRGQSRWLREWPGPGRRHRDGRHGRRRTRTECWNDSFVETYNYTPWDSTTPDAESAAILSLCPDISTL